MSHSSFLLSLAAAGAGGDASVTGRLGGELDSFSLMSEAGTSSGLSNLISVPPPEECMKENTHSFFPNAQLYSN